LKALLVNKLMCEEKDILYSSEIPKSLIELTLVSNVWSIE